MPDVVLFKTEELLPEAWRHFAEAGPVRVFNPGLLQDGDGWIFAYRVVGPDGLRRVGVCRLDAKLHVVNNSPEPFSDRVRFTAGRDYAGPASTWFADPRLYRLQGRIFIYWNSGWHEPRNHQFFQELDASCLAPVGNPRELILRGPRQPLEKNWVFFGNERLHAVYSPAPHRVLEFSIAGEGDVEFSDLATQEWDHAAYAAAHGTLRGGAPPQLCDGHYWSFCHSVKGSEGHYRYHAAVYCFAAATPFAPTSAPTGELSLGNPIGNRRSFPKLNSAVDEVVYPCGAADHDGRWLVSYGINDEHCAIAILSHREVAGAVRPLVRGDDCALQGGESRR